MKEDTLMGTTSVTSVTSASGISLHTPHTNNATLEINCFGVASVQKHSLPYLLCANISMIMQGHGESEDRERSSSGCRVKLENL